MRIIVWLLRAVLFVALLGFAIKNSNIVTLRFFFENSWQLPLVAIMLIFFATGAVFGVTAGISIFLRQRREINTLKREVLSTQPQPNSSHIK